MNGFVIGIAEADSDEVTKFWSGSEPVSGITQAQVLTTRVEARMLAGKLQSRTGDFEYKILPVKLTVELIS